MGVHWCSVVRFDVQTFDSVTADTGAFRIGDATPPYTYTATVEQCFGDSDMMDSMRFETQSMQNGSLWLAKWPMWITEALTWMRIFFSIFPAYCFLQWLEEK